MVYETRLAAKIALDKTVLHVPSSNGSAKENLRIIKQAVMTMR